jgi:hypothetical protein
VHSHAPEEPYVDEGPLETPEFLVLDIGDDVGALIVYAGEACLGREIDITPVGEPQSHLTHSMVRRRRAIERELVACVFPELRAGTYTLWGLDHQPMAEVVIEGGRVTEFDGGPCRRSDHVQASSHP